MAALRVDDHPLTVRGSLQTGLEFGVSWFKQGFSFRVALPSAFRETPQLSSEAPRVIFTPLIRFACSREKVSEIRRRGNVEVNLSTVPLTREDN